METTDSIHIQLNLDDKIYKTLLNDVREVIKQVDNLCIICFGNQDLHNIFTSKCNETFLDTILQTCTGLSVINKLPPHKICSGCVKDLIQVYAFHMRCNKAKQLLEEMKTHKEVAAKSSVNMPAVNVSKKQGANKADNIDVEDGNHEVSIVKKPYRHYDCSICKETFRKFRDLRTHKKKVHPDDTKVICDVCGKLCDDRKKLSDHKILHKDKLITCDTCGRNFKTTSHLQTHRKFVHLGIKRESNELCTLCGKSFTQKSNLKKHMVSHTKEKPYKCDLCGRCFPTHSNLKRHKMSHTGERPHVCEVCGKGFIQKVTLQDHVHKTHGILKNEQGQLISSSDYTVLSNK